MSAKLDNFNWIAGHYDLLKSIVFGKAIYNSQVYFLRTIPQGSNVLMIGGGSGEILNFLAEVNPRCNIWYVEASSKMISLAAKKIPTNSILTVKFLHGTETSLPEGVMFDAIVTNFFLDLFAEAEGLDICKTIYAKLKGQGLWLVSDFVDEGKWWQRILLWTMYRFFVITCKIGASELPKWENVLRSVGVKEMAFQSFYGGFIKSVVYKKTAS